jgi:hypothetical protein
VNNLSQCLGVMGIFLIPYHSGMIYVKWCRLGITRRIGNPKVINAVTISNLILFPVQIVVDIGYIFIGLDPVNGNFEGGQIQWNKRTPMFWASFYAFLIDITFGIIVELITCLMLRSLIVHRRPSINWRDVGFFEICVFLVGLSAFAMNLLLFLWIEANFVSALVIPIYLLWSSLVCGSTVNSIETVRTGIESKHSYAKTTMPGV